MLLMIRITLHYTVSPHQTSVNYTEKISDFNYLINL